MVVSLKNEQVLSQQNQETQLTPASLAKLFITAAALKELGPDYQFETPFYYTGQFKNGEIMGDLIVEGSFDPLLTTERIWQIAADLSHLGLKTVRGRLVVDNSRADGEERDASRIAQISSSRNAYDAPIAPFSINFNTFALVSTQTLDGKPHVQTDPIAFTNVPIIATLKQGPKHTVQITRETKQNKSTLIAKGQVGPGFQRIHRSISTSIEGAEMFRDMLAKFGIRITGEVTLADIPPKAKAMYTFKGEPLARAIHGLNKYSNNFIADMLEKKLGGIPPIQRFLQTYANIKPTLANSSGLDTSSRASAQDVMRLLLKVNQDFSIASEFKSSLPVSGKDGSLRSRMKDDLFGRVRAKTGTLSQPQAVVGLAGFAQSAKHGEVAFVFISNSGTENILALQRKHETILRKYL
jgi:serine-type D-Ala-D-Ala carboxypeptidase/endopeptidase (penicillin-binding protein 4)